MNRGGGGARGSGSRRSSRSPSSASGNQFHHRKSESPVGAPSPSDEFSGRRGRGPQGTGRAIWSIRNSPAHTNEEEQTCIAKKSTPAVKESLLETRAPQERKSQESEVGISVGQSVELTDLNSDNNQDPLLLPAWSTSRNINPKGDPFISGGCKGKDMNKGTRLPEDISMRMEKVSISSPEESPLSSKCAKQDEPLRENDSSSTYGSGGSGISPNRDNMNVFDIFLPKSASTIMLKPSLLAQNREKRNAIKRSSEGHNGIVLRSGMVLLKNYLTIGDQVMAAKTCQRLGLGTGGFYQPGYRDGAVLHLKMMCLGKNWDPETCQYGDHRPVDGAKPPKIPVQFNQLVEKAIKESQALVARNSKHSSGQVELPSMSPDICLVNFYSCSGRLGLHQDKDESEETLRKGLPVVSFSIGDSAEFLYGDQRDVDKAEKVILDSGDVLLFGGSSRKVFHGVKSVLQNTAPKALLQETNLRPGRLNLTFRQY